MSLSVCEKRSFLHQDTFKGQRVQSPTFARSCQIICAHKLANYWVKLRKPMHQQIKFPNFEIEKENNSANSLRATKDKESKQQINVWREVNFYNMVFRGLMFLNYFLVRISQGERKNKCWKIKYTNNQHSDAMCVYGTISV